MPKKSYGKQIGPPVIYQFPTPAGGVQLETFVPWKLVKRGFKKEIITPLDTPQEFMEEARQERKLRESAQDTALMRAIGLAYHWQRLLDDGRFSTMTAIAETEGIDVSQASKLSRLAQLAPDLVEGIALERLKIGVSQLLRDRLSTSWPAQRKALLAGQATDSRVA